MYRTQEEWIKEYENKNGFFIHDGNEKRPHPLLTSGRHSNGFFNSRMIIPDERLLREAASDLVELLMREYGPGTIEHIDRVVGPQTGATKLAEFISDRIGVLRNRLCNWASPAKVGEGDEKRMVFDDPKRVVLPVERVLLCEDVISTGGSVGLTADVVGEKGGWIMSSMLSLVNRSGSPSIDDRKIIALIDKAMPMWLPEECPLCPQGSEAIPPKGENWARLTADY